MGAPFAVAGNFLFNYDFTKLSLGALPATTFNALTAAGNIQGLNFARSTISTVQTSDSAIDSSPAIDDACIGNRGTDPTRRGLVLQHRTKTITGFPGPGVGDDGPRNLTLPNSWQAGSGVTVTAHYAAGPDGVAPGMGCSRVNVSSNGYGPYTSTGGGTGGNGGPESSLSSWQRSRVGDDMQQLLNDGGINSNARVTVRSGSTTWSRIMTPKGSLNMSFFGTPEVVDGRDWTVAGGQTARARDILVDYVQFESTAYATEAIATSLTVRGDDRITYPTGSQWIGLNGQIKQYVKMTMKGSSADKPYYDNGASVAPGVGWFLFSWGAALTNYAYIKVSDRKLYVKLAGGTEVVSTNAISWSQYDLVEMYVAVGSGLASVAKYKLNGGSWVDLVLAPVANFPAPGANPLAVLHNIAPGGIPFGIDDHGQFPCWLHKLTVYGSFGAPEGI